MAFRCLKTLCRGRKKLPEYPYVPYPYPASHTYPVWDPASQPFVNTSSLHGLALHEALDGYPKPDRKYELWWFNTQWPPFPNITDPHDLSRRGHAILYEAATSPPCKRMVVTCSEFPHSKFVIEPSPGVGYVRVGDVLHMVYKYMQQRLKDLEPPYPTGTRDPIWQAMTRFQERQWEEERDRRVGFRRVDCVGKRTKFVGLTRLSDSTWRMELAEWTREDHYI